MFQVASLIDQNIYLVPSFTLECGTVLQDVPVAYKTWGQLNGSKNNAMIICHAFTGSSDVEDWYIETTLPFRYELKIKQVGSLDGSRESIRFQSVLHFLRQCHGLPIRFCLARYHKP